MTMRQQSARTALHRSPKQEAADDRGEEEAERLSAWDHCTPDKGRRATGVCFVPHLAPTRPDSTSCVMPRLIGLPQAVAAGEVTIPRDLTPARSSSPWPAHHAPASATETHAGSGGARLKGRGEGPPSLFPGMPGSFALSRGFRAAIGAEPRCRPSGEGSFWQARAAWKKATSPSPTRAA